VVDVAFPYFGNREHDHFEGTDHPDVLMKRVPVREGAELAEGALSPRCSTCLRQLRPRPRPGRRMSRASL
jgi:nitrate reductase alpha subunit